MDASWFPFLSTLADNVSTIREEVLAFRNDERIAAAQAAMVQMSTSKKVMATPNSWLVLAFLTHFHDPDVFTKKYQTSFAGMNADQLMGFYAYWRGRYFKRTQELVRDAAADESNGLISVVLSTMVPGSVLTPHINFDPYMYRAHVPIIVPEGDVAIQVGKTIHRWKEGEPFVFDSTIPHAAWNMASSDRINLLVDFLRPDRDRKEMLALELEQRERMLANDPKSYGFSGGQYGISAEAKSWFVLPEARTSTPASAFV